MYESLIEKQTEFVERHRSDAESLAQAGYRDYGRGLVLVAGASALGGWTMLYFPLTEAMPMCDSNQSHALLTYAPETHFLILFGDLVLDLSVLYACRLSHPALAYALN